MSVKDALLKTDEYKAMLILGQKYASDALLKAVILDSISRFERLIEECKLYLNRNIQVYPDGSSTVTYLSKSGLPDLVGIDASYKHYELVKKVLEQTENEFSGFLRINARGAESDPQNFYAKRQIKIMFDSAFNALQQAYLDYKNRLYEFIKKRDGVGPTNLNLKDRPNMITEIQDMVRSEIEQNKAAIAAKTASPGYKCRGCPAAPLKPPTVPPVDNKKLSNQLGKPKRR